jgi:hypothetical protein
LFGSVLRGFSGHRGFKSCFFFASHPAIAAGIDPARTPAFSARARLPSKPKESVRASNRKPDRSCQRNERPHNRNFQSFCQDDRAERIRASRKIGIDCCIGKARGARITQGAVDQIGNICAVDESVHFGIKTQNSPAGCGFRPQSAWPDSGP